MRVFAATMSEGFGEERHGCGRRAARHGLAWPRLPALLLIALLLALTPGRPASAQTGDTQTGAPQPGDPQLDLASGDYFIGASVFLFQRGVMSVFAPKGSDDAELDRGAIYLAVVNSQGESGSIALDTIHGWLVAWARGDGDPPGFDPARRGHLACLIVGADPKAAADLAAAAGLDEAARLACADEYRQAAARWSALLAPYRRGVDLVPPPATPPGTGTLAVEYAPAIEPANDLIAQAMQKNQLFDALTDELNAGLAMPADTLALLTECRKPASFYNPDRREIVFCYELLGGILAAAGK